MALYVEIAYCGVLVCLLLVGYNNNTVRRLLFTDENVLRHQIGKGQAAFKWHKRRSPNASLGDEDQVETQGEPHRSQQLVANGIPLHVLFR